MSYSSVVLADSPIVWWRLTETSEAATFADASGNGNTGVVQSGAPTLGVTGPLGSAQTSKAITVNGFAYLQASGVLLKGYPASRTAMSLEVWVRTTDSASSFATAMGWDGLGVEAIVNQSSQFAVYLRDRAALVGSALADGKWHHIVGTFNGGAAGGTIITYLDGQPITTITGVGSAIGTDSATDAYTVGGGGFDNDFFIGSLAEPAVYPTTLSPTQVLAHYTAALPINNPAGGGGWNFFAA